LQDSPLVPKIADWLYRQALVSADIEETVGGLGERLLAGGIPVCRINVGAMLLHPVLGAVDVTWESRTNTVIAQAVPRHFVTTDGFRNSPFCQMGMHNSRYERYDLTDENDRKKYPILERLAGMDITDYAAFSETFGQSRNLGFASMPPSAEGSYLSYSTKRRSGFEDQELDRLRELSLPFSIALKVAVDKQLTMTLLETYLGKNSGRSVFYGATSRGDGRIIDCVLWYSDLRNSTSLAASMDMTDYLTLINEYYTCTAGAVLEHGGEVLKFIGDGVLAIFPYDPEARPLRDMTNAAVMTAKDALNRKGSLNRQRPEAGLVPIEFGVGLHVGQVKFGNVGTDQRLDMTVIGPAVNEVTRYESMTKELNAPILTSEDFKQSYYGDLKAFGTHDLKGVATAKQVFGVII